MAANMIVHGPLSSQPKSPHAYMMQILCWLSRCSCHSRVLLRHFSPHMSAPLAAGPLSSCPPSCRETRQQLQSSRLGCPCCVSSQPGSRCDGLLSRVRSSLQTAVARMVSNLVGLGRPEWRWCLHATVDRPGPVTTYISNVHELPPLLPVHSRLTAHVRRRAIRWARRLLRR